MLSSRQRLLKALNNEIPDRLPVTTHHLMPYFLNKYMGGISDEEFFDFFKLDMVKWAFEHKPDTEKGEYVDPGQAEPGYLEHHYLCSDNWRIERKPLHNSDYNTLKYNCVTPKGTLSMVLQGNEQTEWITEALIKEKDDFEIFEEYAPAPLCDNEKVNTIAEDLGERGIIRGAVPGFDIYGQPGCWQDLAVLMGTEDLIVEIFTDPDWVHKALRTLCERKKKFIKSLCSAKFDLIELGGGSASSTVISPDIFEKFVAPYDAELIELAKGMGFRIVYHICGGIMPVLDMIKAMKPAAIETFTPPSMGGDAILAEARKILGKNICMIGGFDQYHYFTNCDVKLTRRAVRYNFEETGTEGGYILAPSDHFFDADIQCIEAFADEAVNCCYD